VPVVFAFKSTLLRGAVPDEGIVARVTLVGSKGEGGQARISKYSEGIEI